MLNMKEFYTTVFILTIKIIYKSFAYEGTKAEISSG